MRFYIASSRDGLVDVATLYNSLVGSGHVCAFDWRQHLDHKCSQETCGISGSDGLAWMELKAAADCDWFFGISRMGRGAHAELGAALLVKANGYRAGRKETTGPTIVLVGVDPADSVFYRSRHVEVVKDVDAVLTWTAMAYAAESSIY